MKKTAFLLSVVMIITSCFFQLNTNAETNTYYKEFYVSADGNDNGDGSQQSPFKTIERAKQEVKKYNAKMTGDIAVNILGGTYYQTESIDFLTEDSGFNGYNVIYRGIDAPIISGGRLICGFVPSSRKDGVYELYLPQYLNKGIFELYNADGGKRQLAKSDKLVKPNGDYNNPSTNYSADGMLFNKDDLPDLQNLNDSEFVWYRGWNVRKLHPQSITTVGENKAVSFYNPVYDEIYKDTTYNATKISSSVSCYLQNDFSLLDTPGEFYYDTNTGYLYYMPLEFENIETESFIVPTLDTFAFLFGEKTAENEENSVKVKNIVFEGIKFKHFTADKSYKYYFASGQGPYYEGRNKSIYSNDNGIFYLNRADNISFYSNEFSESLQTPVNMRNDVTDCTVYGNLFNDLGSSAIDIGETAHINNKNDENGYTVEKLPQTDYNLMITDPYISASDIYNSNGKNIFSNLTVMPNYKHPQFYPYKSFKTTSVTDKTKYKQYGNPNTWIGGGNDKKAWIKYDFSRKYNFSEILLGFDPNDISQNEKCEFEVRLSNDENFSDGNYVTVYKSNSSDYGEIVDIKPNTDEKYRYMLVTATQNSYFAVTNIIAFTPDIPNQIIRRGCKNINIKNNVINNACSDEFSQSGIFVFYCDNLNIENNEFTNLPYSGITYGYNWSSNGLCGKGSIKGNYFNNTTQMLYDGAAIYTLGSHTGTEISNNYVSNAGAGMAYYLDNGTEGILMNNNIDEFSGMSICINSGSYNCTVNNFYSTYYQKFIKGENHTINNNINYEYMHESEAVQSIKNGAGTVNKLKYSINPNIYSIKPDILGMGLESDCWIAQERIPRLYKNIKASLKNTQTAISANNAGYYKINDALNKYSTCSTDNIKGLIRVSKTLPSFLSKNVSDIVYVRSEYVKDYTVDETAKTVTLYTDFKNRFSPVFLCESGAVLKESIENLECGGNYKIMVIKNNIGTVWNVEVKPCIEINVSEDEKISNIGLKPLLKINYHYADMLENITQNSIVIKNTDKNIAYKLTPYSTANNEYAIDNSSFANADLNNGVFNIPYSPDINAQIKINIDSLGVSQTYTRIIDGNIIPVKYIEGKIIINAGADVKTDGNIKYENQQGNLSDENPATYIEYKSDDRTDKSENGYFFRTDIEQTEKIAAVVVQSGVSRPRDFGWDNNYTYYCASKHKMPNTKNCNTLFEISSEGITQGEKIGVTFDYGNAPQYRYIYAAPQSERTASTLLLGELYVYVYKDEPDYYQSYDLIYDNNSTVKDGVNIYFGDDVNGKLLNTVKGEFGGKDNVDYYTDSNNKKILRVNGGFPQKSIDGNIKTYSGCAVDDGATVVNPYLELDLGNANVIRDITILLANNTDTASAPFTIKVSENGNDWVDLAAENEDHTQKNLKKYVDIIKPSENSLYRKISINNYNSYRYIRFQRIAVLQNGGYATPWINEIDVNGYYTNKNNQQPEISFEFENVNAQKNIYVSAKNASGYVLITAQYNNMQLCNVDVVNVDCDYKISPKIIYDNTNNYKAYLVETLNSLKPVTDYISY